MSDLSGRLGMASAGDALGIGRLSVAWRYLAVPSSTNCCLGVAAGTLSYLTLTLRLPSAAYRSGDRNESGTGHSLQYKNVYVGPSR